MFIRWRRCRHRRPAAARPEVPYDPSGLSAALEELGLDAAEVVEAANTMPSTFHAAGYGTPIHEQVGARKDPPRPRFHSATASTPMPRLPPSIPATVHVSQFFLTQVEMATNCFGQWELNNQPVWALQAMQVAHRSPLE